MRLLLCVCKKRNPATTCWYFPFASDGDAGRSVATDGSFLYISGGGGPGIAKIGTGLHGTLR